MNKMFKNQKTGKNGEEIAVKYLKSKRFKILDRNFRTKFGEIDIIAQDKKEIVFVEVKTRTSTKYGLPCEAVTKTKIEHIKKSAMFYLYSKKLENVRTRIDVIEVYTYGDKNLVHHLKQVI